MRCISHFPNYKSGISCPGLIPYLSSYHSYRELLDLLSTLSVEKNNFIFGHLPFSKTVSKLLEEEHVVVLIPIRDPRDVIISQMNYIMSNKNHSLNSYFASLSSNIERLKALIIGVDSPVKKQRLLPINEIYRQMKGWTKNPRSLVVYYENLVGPRGKGSELKQKNEIYKISNKIGVSLRKSDIENICDQIYCPQTPGFRKGVAGDWQNELGPDILETFNLCAQETLLEWNYN
ncbi:Sulfotransferase domain protein [Prochlorococcus sp. MIT 1303]|nr:Sulfotransferase domain protein [Prochlorococcus sp. MIT 1303]